MHFKFLIALIFATSFIVQMTQAQENKGMADSAQGYFSIEWKHRLCYPKKAEENNISGTVIVSFDIDSTCSIVNIKIVKGIGYGCDEEAIKLVKLIKIIPPKDHKCVPRRNMRQTFNFSNSDD